MCLFAVLVSRAVGAHAVLLVAAAYCVEHGCTDTDCGSLTNESIICCRAPLQSKWEMYSKSLQDQNEGTVWLRYAFVDDV